MKNRALLRSSKFIFVCLILAVPFNAYAYVGPGAGFAFLGSAFVAIATIGLAIVTIALWPLTLIWRKMRGRGVPKGARARRVVVVGLDGLDPKLVDRFISEGRLPNMKALSQSGSYSRLGTTLPALSPVAWSSFQTGVNPGAHNIFDFLTRDKRYCLPELSSTKTVSNNKTVGFGPFKWTKLTGVVKLLRMSKPFWKILGDRGIFSNIIRVPISYPPEKFKGNILSAMCTPDLRGTQGSFSFFTTAPVSDAKATVGWFRELKQKDGHYTGFIEGPAKPDSKTGEVLKVEFTLSIDADKQQAVLNLPGQSVVLSKDEFSPWIEIEFILSRSKKVTAISRFCLREITPHISLYMTPLNIHPDKPALPISQPAFFSKWLAKKHGLFGTLGLMEDTWGRNELVLDDQRFLDQTYSIHEEREKMLLDTLDRTREGLCVCVFDASDRIQHMFWRYMEKDHPSALEDKEKFGATISDMYDKMDEVVGKVQAKLNPKDLLFVISDHGFSSFKRGINLNTWLYENGYLALKSGKISDVDYFQDVDWTKTKAFAVGLTGIYLNKKGRESHGILSDAEAKVVKQELIDKLEGIKDPKTAEVAIRRMYDSAKEYRGLYAKEAPDLIAGYSAGYRVSWESITGALEKDIFSDNIKAWSGDHHVDPELVPGIFFSNRKLKSDTPHITDIAPTILDVFSVPIPSYMEGQVIL
jgi:predicted AlkP superfamily phosphohydrolase/phosphomutase